MTRTELAVAVADRTGLSKSHADRAVEAVFQCIADSLRSGEDVRVLGFGNFQVAERPANIGRHPATGAAIAIPSSRQPKFKPAQGLKELLNS